MRRKRSQRKGCDLTQISGPITQAGIRWANRDPTTGQEQSGTRLVPTLSKDVVNRYSGTVIAVTITSQPSRAGFPLMLFLSEAKLPKSSRVKISQIRTLSMERIGPRIGNVPDAVVREVIEGLNEILGV